MISPGIHRSVSLESCLSPVLSSRLSTRQRPGGVLDDPRSERSPYPRGKMTESLAIRLSFYTLQDRGVP